MNEFINEIKNMTTKQKVVIGIGLIIFLNSDISMIGKIIIIAGIASYIFMNKQLLANNTLEHVKEIKNTLVIPILQIIAAYFLYEGGAEAIKSASKIDRLHNISTYTPYLGDLGKGLDIANQMGVISDVERSQSTLEFINAAGMANNIVSIGMVIIVALALAELYGVFRFGKFTKKQMLMFYGGISVTLLVCSIFFGIYIEKYVTVLSSIFSGVDEYPIAILLGIITLLIVGLLYKLYSKALERLYDCSNIIEKNTNQVINKEE
jgi:hypothetical protein